MTAGLLVGVLGFHLQLLLACFTNPAVLAVDKCVIVDSLAVVFDANVAFHPLTV